MRYGFINSNDSHTRSLKWVENFTNESNFVTTHVGLLRGDAGCWFLGA